jgi:MFS transporter, DHA2 family, multidrug resistance protein
MAWTGLPQLVLIPFVPALMKRFDSRLIVGTGLSIFAVSCFMNLWLDHDYGGPQLFYPNVVRAFGQSLILTPLSAIAMVGISPQEAGAASGLFNMVRNLGGAVGTAMIETFFTKREQYHSFIINQHVSLLEPATRARLDSARDYFLLHGVPDPAEAMHQAIISVATAVKMQATIMGYADCFGLMGMVLVAAAVSVAVLKKGSSAGGAAH